MKRKLLLSITPATTVEELRRNLIVALQKVIDQIPNTNDGGGDRIVNVGDPTAASDVVTKRFLDQALATAITAANPSILDFVRGATNLGTPGAVPFVIASGVLGVDKTKFFWDAVNHRLGIGTVTPAYPLDVVGDAQVSADLHVGGKVTATSDITTLGIYKVGAASGLTTTITPAASLSVTTDPLGVFGTPGVGQANSDVVVGVTLNFGTPRQFTGGIITA